MVLGDTLFFSNHSEEHASNISFVSNHLLSNRQYRLMYWLFVLPCCCVYESTRLMPAVVSHKSCNQCQFWRFFHVQCDLQLFICPCLSFLNDCFCHLKSRNLSHLGKIILIPWSCSNYIFWDEFRLQDVVHSERRLYLVFEYLDLDLKKHMDTCPDLAKDPRLIKVWWGFCPSLLQLGTNLKYLFLRVGAVVFWVSSSSLSVFQSCWYCILLPCPTSDGVTWVLLLTIMLSREM